VMRELIPVVLASYLDPHAYGRQRTCYYAPTVGGAGTERIYAGPLTSECFRRAQESVPGKQGRRARCATRRSARRTTTTILI